MGISLVQYLWRIQIANLISPDDRGLAALGALGGFFYTLIWTKRGQLGLLLGKHTRAWVTLIVTLLGVILLISLYHLAATIQKPTAIGLALGFALLFLLRYLMGRFGKRPAQVQKQAISTTTVDPG
jgi:hypothetical protein